MLKPLDHAGGHGQWSDAAEQRTPWREDGQRNQGLRQVSRLVPPPEPGPLVESGAAAGSGLAGPSPLPNPPLKAAWIHVTGAPAPAPVAAAGTQAADQSELGRESCQQRVDTKAFTGRGEPRAVREAAAAVDRLHLQMDQLVATSGRSRVAQLYLALHVRSTGQHSLRWRGLTTAGGHAHLSWDDARRLIGKQPYGMQAQLVAWDVQAKSLNAEEIKARLDLKRARAAAAKLTKAVPK